MEKKLKKSKKQNWVLAVFVIMSFSCGAELIPTAPEVIHDHHHHEPEIVEAACVVPGAEDPGWGTFFKGEYTTKVAVEAAKAVIGDPCGTHPEATLILLADTLVDAGWCAGFVKDAVMIAIGDDFWEEVHSVEFNKGCWTGHRAYKFTHRYTK